MRIRDWSSDVCSSDLFATAAGLQILDRKGDWVDVPLMDGAMIMNIGDMMEILSNGRYVATTHRVKKVAQQRYAFPFFHACDYDYVLAPLVGDEAPRYAPLQRSEERRVGKEWVSTCRSRRCPSH